MGLKVIGAGLGRTGTLSTQAALNRLGFRCYHMEEVLQFTRNRSHIDFWREVACSPPGTQHDWSRVFANYSATVDNPGCCVWRELMQAYPEAKVLLTLHPGGASAWYDSTFDTIYFFTERSWQFKVLAFLTPMGRKYRELARKLIWGRTLKGAMDDRPAAVARYDAYAEEVKAAVPADRLLIFKVSEGWEPLCAFLGVPKPEEEFPRLNDRSAIRRSIARYNAIAYALLACVAVAAAGAIIGGWRLLN